MYERNGTYYGNAQEIFDVAIAQAKKNIAHTVTLAGFFNETVTIAPMGEKTLLPKPHPEGCTCLKCPQEQEPEGVHLLPQGKVRIGDAVKDEYLDHLREALGGGIIGLEEFEARSNAVMAASTREQLGLLVRDLPVMSVMKKKEVIQAPPPPEPPTVFCWLLNLFMVLLPVIAGLGVLFHGDKTVTAVVALAGGAAALIMTCMGKTGLK